MATFRNTNRPGFRIRGPGAAAPERSDEPPPEPDEPVEAPDRWWRESSFDLRQGLDVREEDTIPGELLDELFRPKKR